MTKYLLNYICEPITGDPLELKNPIYDGDRILTGDLVSSSGNVYKIVNGIPRFVDAKLKETVDSFGDEWNHFNFTDHKKNWLQHTVKNTFGATDVFSGKLIIDAGAGSGAISKWFCEYGAKHVILLELSHSVDGVVQRNLKGFENVDVIQCSIDNPPLKTGSINGMVYCHNVIQHTKSVENTAHSLFNLLSPGGEFVFNCYQLNDNGFFRWIRWHFIHIPMRTFLSRRSFRFILNYARVMSVLRLVPGLGEILEKMLLVGQGDVPVVESDTFFGRLKRRYRSARLNTFDAYGSHSYQNDEIKSLVKALQPNAQMVLNADRYFMRPTPIGCALRVLR